MSGILKIKRDNTSPATLNDGEFYLNKGINTVQIGSGSSILTLLPLNQIVTGDIILNGNIYANNFGISSSYAETASYAIFAQTTGNVLSASYANISSTASYILSSNVDGPNGLNSILTASLALTASFAPNYLQLSNTGSMLNPYLLTSNTGSMLLPYVLNSQTASFVTNNQTSSFVTNSQTGSFLLNNQTGSMLSSYVLNSQTASFVTNNQTSSFVTNSQTGSFVLNSQTSSMTVATASFVSGSVFTSNNQALSASYAQTASLALGVVGFSNLASSSYPFNATGSTIYSFNSNISQSSFLNVNPVHSFIVGERAGIDALYDDFTGTSNSHSIMIGYEAGRSTFESNYNIFLGNTAGKYVYNTSHSIFLGNSSGENTAAHNSIFAGFESGYFAENANNSIFLGKQSGWQSTFSSHSIFIGYHAGKAFTGNTAGSNNIIIGTNISIPNNIRNSINLGGILFASGTYSTVTGNPQITPQINGRIGVNIYPRSYNLEVSGTTNISNGLYVTNSINLTGSNNHIGNYILTGSILSTGSNVFNGVTTISGSLITSGSNTFNGQQTISGSLNIVNDLVVLGSASFYYFSTTFVTTSTIIATGSNSLGDTIDDVQTLIGTVNISGSLVVTGSAFLTASNVAGGSSSYIPIWKTENSLDTSSIYQSSENVLIGTTTNPNSNFKLHISGNLSVNEFQISSISASNNLNYVGIFRPSGSGGNTNFLETAQTQSQYKWVFRGVNGFGEKREWNQNNSSIFNINLGWSNSAITTFTGSTLLIDPHINVTNGNAVMLRGIYYNPTISASVNTNHIAIETTTGSILFRNIPTNTTITNVLLYDTASGQLYYTASSAIGGGSGTTISSDRIYSGSVTASINVGTGSIFTLTSSSIDFLKVSSSREIVYNNSYDRGINFQNEGNVFYFGPSGTRFFQDANTSFRIVNGTYTVFNVTKEAAASNRATIDWQTGGSAQFKMSSSAETTFLSQIDSLNTFVKITKGYDGSGGRNLAGTDSNILRLDNNGDNGSYAVNGNISRGLYINLDNRGFSKYRAIETTVGDVILCTTIGSGSVGIGLSNPSYSLHVSGTIGFPNLTTGTHVTNLLTFNNSTGQLFYTSSNYFIRGGTGTPNYIPVWSDSSTLGNSVIYQSSNKIGIGTTSPAAKLDVVGTTTNVLRVYGSGSSDVLAKVDGSQGELFSVTDSITGSLFSVNDISGLPIIDVNSDSTILMGNYAAPSLNTTVKFYKTDTTQSYYLIPTASYDAAFVEYFYVSGSEYGSGYFMVNWSGSSIQTADNNTINTGVSPVWAASVSGENISLDVESIEMGYMIKAIIRSI